MKTFRLLLRILFLLPVAWGALQAQVGTDFTIVADDTQPAFQNGFGTYPSISDDGTVAFVVDQVGTFRAAPGQAPMQVGGSVTGDPFINKMGEIASRQYVDAFLTTELYKNTPAGQTVSLVRNDGEFRQFGLPVHLSSTGTAVFWARKNPVSPGHWGIWTANGGGTTNFIVDNLGIFSVFGNSPTINNAGKVAFTAGKDPVNNVAETGLYVGTGGGDANVTTVLTAAGSPLYNWDGGPYINDQGRIAFKAYEDNTGEPGIFVVNQDGTGLTTIARAGGIGGSGPYSTFDSPIINELGTVAFRGYLDTGEHGIYVGADPVADKVIQEGDPLFGSTLTSVLFLRGLNNRNEISFYFALADGRTGIAKAKLATANPTPTPTPTATPAPTATATPVPTATATPIATATPGPTATPSASPVPTPNPTATATPAPTVSPSPSATATPGNTVTPSPTASPIPAAQPLNIATRGRVETGDNAMIGGFIINGNGPKKVVVRAIGPSLQGLLSGALTDPVLELRGSDGALLSQNDNWRDDAVQASYLEANGFAPSHNLESALVATLSPGSYTAAVTGKNGATGVGIVEVYDASQGSNSKLANLSTRGVVQSGENVLIGGFILGGGNANTKVLVRAIGPSLANFGVNNAVTDPTLELRDSNGGLIRSNDNWKDQQATEIEPTGLAPAMDAESVIMADLPAGAYTAIVASKGANGIGLVEIYNLP